MPLVNKEAALVYGRAEYNKVENLSRDRRGKKIESEIYHAVAEEKDAGVLQISHNIVAIHKLIEMD